ncbi:MAG: hypothetical protein IPJ19_05900 [Planctomycetes bacterium]|nr:hypothetical protein [Planctomycetota bacterium]
MYFFDNEAGGANGGGLYFTGAPGFEQRLNIKTSEFRSNHVESKGGALFGAFLKTGDIVNVLFNENYTLLSDGGAVYLEDMAPTSTLWFTNCIYYRNTANTGAGGSGHGGGLCLGTGSSFPGNAQVVNCTMVLNSAPSTANGHAVYLGTGATCEVHNSILYFNPTAASGAYPLGGTAPAALTYSDVQGATPNTITVVINTLPQFRSLVSPDTLHLLGPGQATPPSDCIDHADRTKLPFDNLDVNDDGFTTTQIMPVCYTGSVRNVDWLPSANLGVPANTYVDMGAFEKQ